MKRVAILLAIGILAPPANSQNSPLWKCSDPAIPFHFVTSEDKKSQPPPCREWMQIRGPNLMQLLTALADERHPAANEFLAEAAEYAPFEYPGAEEGAPVPTSALYYSPERFGFEIKSLTEAPLGSLVVYNGLGGILVETRISEAEPWTRQVLYPSASAGYRLKLSDPDIPGKLVARVLVPEGEM